MTTRPFTTRLRRRLVVAVLMVFAAVLGLGPAGAAADPILTRTAGPVTAETASDEPVVTVQSFTPGTLRPKAGLTVTVRVTAGADAIPAGSRLELRLQRDKLTTRYGVSAWSTAGIQDAIGSTLQRIPLADAVPARASTTVSFRVPADRIGLPDQPTAFGPRGVSVVLRDPDAIRQAVARTFLVWQPTTTRLSELGMSVVVPVTAGQPAATTGLPDPAALGAAAAPSGRLSRLLTAAGRAGVTMAVDPALLATDASGSTAAQLTAWRRQLVQQARTHQAIALPSGNPDAAALAHNDGAELFRWSVTQGRAQAVALGSPVQSVALPAAGLLDAATARMLQQNGFGCAVLRESANPSLSELGVTPTGRSTLEWPDSTGAEPLCGLLADDVLTDLLAGPTQENPDVPTGVAAVQRVLAETAAIAEQNPSRKRHVLAVAPIEWNPGSTGDALLAAMVGQPWTTPWPLSQLMSTPSAGIDRSSPTITAEQRSGELQGGAVNTILREVDVARQASRAATSESDQVFGQVRQPAVGLVSQAWRGDAEDWNRAITTFSDTVRDVRTAVHVVPGSDVTQVSRDVRLPVTVQNELGVPVRVLLRASPTSNMLQVVDDSIEVELPRDARTVAYVPVRGVGSGTATVRVAVVTQDGYTLDDASAIRVRVRADWENRATLIVGGIFLVILLAGIARTLRRGQTRAATIDPTTGESSR